ncbi:unnamed protein product [Cuscuta europaea]|uniref:N-acetylglucosaminylphosphatidylinositol deacetylase n=1 Tax=Cuscuta europaea TaxID=41803 RepID=A0A9P0ZMQ9_CUSEU|nr:unnamed protein product [Cuscuta europaea]
MEWVLIIVLLTVIWVGSLCTTLHEFVSDSKSMFLDDGGFLMKKKILLVIAHPDDESMFFTPTINYLMSKGHDLRILCISTGNADGLGNTRKQELYWAATTLNVIRNSTRIAATSKDLGSSRFGGWFWQNLEHRSVGKTYERRSRQPFC